MGRLGRIRTEMLLAGGGAALVVGFGLLALLAGTVGVVVGLVAVQVGLLVLLVWVAATLWGRLRELRRDLDRQSAAADPVGPSPDVPSPDAPGPDEAAATPSGSGGVTSAELTQQLLSEVAGASAPASELAGLRERLVAQLWVQSRTDRERGAGDAAVRSMELALAVADGDPVVALQHERLVAELAAQPDGLPAAYAAIDRQLRVGDLDQAARLTQRLTQRSASRSASPAPALGRRLVALRDAEGRPEQALDLALRTASDLVAELTSLRPARPDPDDAARRLTRAQRVMVSGLLYSGSGAVLDHLGDLGGVVTWPPEGELRILRGVGGYADLHRRLEATGRLEPQDLVDHFLHLLGGKVVDAPLGQADPWRVVDRAAGWLEQAGPAAAGYLGVLLEGFVSLTAATHDGGLDPAGFEAWVRAQLSRALDAVAADAGADWVVCDQAVTAWQLGLARYLPPATIVLVHRDPRDQFVEVREVFSQPGRSGKVHTPEGFVARQQRVEADIASLLPALEAGHGHRFLRVAFEAFVCDHDVEAARIHAAIAVDGRGPAAGELARGRRFDPAVSRRNVGKHRDVLDAEVAGSLVAALPAHLSPHAGPWDTAGDPTAGPAQL